MQTSLANAKFSAASGPSGSRGSGLEQPDASRRAMPMGRLFVQHRKEANPASARREATNDMSRPPDWMRWWQVRSFFGETQRQSLDLSPSVALEPKEVNSSPPNAFRAPGEMPEFPMSLFRETP